MKSRIRLEDIKIYAHHGVFEEETQTGTYYLVNLELEVDLEKASRSDELEDTVNYALVSAIVHEEMKTPSKLLEHVAGRILRRLHQEFEQISALRIAITKISPPMKGEMKGVTIELEQSFH